MHMLLTNRYKHLIAATSISGVLLISAASVQAASCTDQSGQTGCGETENSVSWVFQSDQTANSPAARQESSSAAVQPLILASSISRHHLQMKGRQQKLFLSQSKTACLPASACLTVWPHHVRPLLSLGRPLAQQQRQMI